MKRVSLCFDRAARRVGLSRDRAVASHQTRARRRAGVEAPAHTNRDRCVGPGRLPGAPTHGAELRPSGRRLIARPPAGSSIRDRPPSRLNGPMVVRHLSAGRPRRAFGASLSRRSAKTSPTSPAGYVSSPPIRRSKEEAPTVPSARIRQRPHRPARGRRRRCGAALRRVVPRWPAVSTRRKSVMRRRRVRASGPGLLRASL